MIVVTNQENFRPEILVQLMLISHDGQIIAGRNHATVQNNEIIFAGRKNDSLLGATAEGDAGEEDGGVIRNFT